MCVMLAGTASALCVTWCLPAGVIYCDSKVLHFPVQLMSILRSPELLLNVTGNFCNRNFDDEADRLPWRDTETQIIFPD